MYRGTVHELFVHNDWARDQVLTAARDLYDQQLDRPFEIGCGTLRATLRHLYGAERVWFERWQGAAQPQFPRARTLTTVEELRDAHRKLAQARALFIDQLADDDWPRPVNYTDPHGRTQTRRLGDLLLHVCNHGVHHRAQALFMLRQLGCQPPGLDYLLMRVVQPTVEIDPDARARLREAGLAVGDSLEPPIRLALGPIRPYFRYNDWANRRVLALAGPLDDHHLDRDLKIGLGRLRKTLLHIRDGEQWWYENWTNASPAAFEQLPETISVAELESLLQNTAARRDAYLDGLTDDDLQRVVAAEARAGVVLHFRLGESLLQLLGHGTHHRAQAVNMLRRLGTAPPALEYVNWAEEPA